MRTTQNVKGGKRARRHGDVQRTPSNRREAQHVMDEKMQLAQRNSSICGQEDPRMDDTV